MLRAIIHAILSAMRAAGKGIDWFLSIFGIGGGAPAAKIEPEKIGLPTLDELKRVQESARGQQKAADLMISTALAQVHSYACARPKARLDMNLDKLNLDQTIWLMKLSERELSLVAKATDIRLQAALDGDADPIDGVRPLVEPKPDTTSRFTKRILDKKQQRVLYLAEAA
ncbi:hypothetical protein [Rhizobium sp. C1]|uniref:hypothetical protein n=1 Tax=Rhizobium sp. C1 TaxID=1349799 RepID=UPI001E304395|nr:hypothetical protein [Rhizobium sp. C1]MCD2177343.1 hypothetical protein [Rhizobium sp. C1]